MAASNNNWSSELKAILSTVDMHNVYDYKSTCDLQELKRKLVMIDTTKWQEDIRQKPKLRTYILFKSQLEAEHYVTSIIPRWERSVFAKLRCGILPLHIETGCYNNTKPEFRVCELCDTNEIEDEKHFVCICTLYKDLREKLYAKIRETNIEFEQMSTDEKFEYLLSKKQCLVSKFAFEAFVKRRQKLYTS